MKDIPDNKAFYPCADDCAKSHLKWAEAFWLLLGSKSNEENLLINQAKLPPCNILVHRKALYL